MEAIKDHSGLSSIPISIFEPKEISELKSLAYFKFYFNLKKIVQILKYFFKSKYEKTT